MAHLGLGMLDTLDVQIELIFMAFGLALVLGSPVCQDPEQWDLLLFKEWDHLVVENIRSGDSMFGFIEFGEGDPAISVDKGLLIDASDTFDVPDIVRVLGTQVSGMFGLYFSKRFSALFFPLYSH